MRDKYLYQRRKGLETQKEYTKGYNYKGYTKDGFYFKTTTPVNISLLTLLFNKLRHRWNIES